MLKSLRERDGELIQNWYIACLGHELKSKPLAVRVYEKNYVLFRDEKGKAVCLPDRCLHRGVKLSEGQCEVGTLRCPYHGWVYDGAGRVVEIPSEQKKVCDEPVRAGLTLDPIPCVEQDECIWIWAGDPKKINAPLPYWRFPHLEDKGWAHYFMVTDFRNEVTNLVENFMDVPHTIFVHKGWFRTPKQKEVRIQIEVSLGQVLVTYHQPKDSIGFTGRLINPLNRPMIHTDQFIYPNLTRVDYKFGDTSAFVINSQCTPREAMQTRVYTYIAYKVGPLTPLIKPLMRLYTRRVIEQDVEIMDNQGTNLISHGPQKFKMSEIDEIYLAIEQIREMASRGDKEFTALSKNREKVFWI